MGTLLGDPISGTGYKVFKVRVPNRDRARGKSGGYRILYYLQTNTETILVTIYSKTEQADISANQIRRIIDDFQEEDSDL
jgi:mRNA-degrading endonuclease RelE of RelBE toxin-antitoxin system